MCRYMEHMPPQRQTPLHPSTHTLTHTHRHTGETRTHQHTCFSPHIKNPANLRSCLARARAKCVDTRTHPHIHTPARTGALQHRPLSTHLAHLRCCTHAHTKCIHKTKTCTGIDTRTHMHRHTPEHTPPPPKTHTHLAQLLSCLAGVRAWCVHKCDNGQPKLVCMAHEAQCLAVTIGLGHAKVAADVFLHTQTHTGVSNHE